MRSRTYCRTLLIISVLFGSSNSGKITTMNTAISSNNHIADVYRVHTMCQALLSKSLL